MPGKQTIYISTETRKRMDSYINTWLLRNGKAPTVINVKNYLRDKIGCIIDHDNQKEFSTYIKTLKKQVKRRNQRRKEIARKMAHEFYSGNEGSEHLIERLELLLFRWITAGTINLKSKPQVDRIKNLLKEFEQISMLFPEDISLIPEDPIEGIDY